MTQGKIRQWIQLVEALNAPVVPSLLYHGTTPAKAKSIIANGLQPRGKKNTFGISVSFSDKPVGTRHYDRGAILVFKFLPNAKLISLSDFQRNGRGDADAVASNPEGYFQDREIAVFNPQSVKFLGYFNLQTRTVQSDAPVYPKEFYHSWSDEA